MSRGKVSDSVAPMPDLARFNGAAAHEPRKADASGMRSFVVLRFNGAAAHEPRKEATDLPAGRPHAARFNGAAAHEPRKASEPNVPPSALCASMGPRLMSRGKVLMASGYLRTNCLLQWGRGS